MAESILLSCYVLTRNSEARLTQVLASVREVIDDLIVVDSGSTDGTEAIAETYGARFVLRQFDDFRSQRSFALSLCENNWVLELDSDEVVSDELRYRIQQLKSADFAPSGNTPDAFGIRREWFVLGKKIHCFYPSRCPDRPIRLYQRSKTNYDSGKGIHEAASGYKITEPIDEPILHYTCDTLDQMYAKVNQYTTLAAREMYAAGERSNELKILIFPWLLWFKFYVLRGGWRDGALGLVHGRYVRDTVWQKLVKLKYDFPESKSAEYDEIMPS